MYEVEQKFRVADFDAVNRLLDDLGGSAGETVTQVDRYFRHPARNFASTDEALRVRRIGDDNFITYKGPKIDSTTKTRREIELPMTSGVEWLEAYCELMGCLGFEVVTDVEKSRSQRTLQFEGWEFEVALDEVREVGRFVELETTASEQDLDDARGAMANLANALELKDVERTSYLGLLLSARGET